MILKAVLGEVRLEIWFTPSFNIKTTDKAVELLLREMELEVFDPWENRMRKVKATKGIREAYLVIEELGYQIPQLKVKIEERPELPTSDGTEKDPATY